MVMVGSSVLFWVLGGWGRLVGLARWVLGDRARVLAALALGLGVVAMWEHHRAGAYATLAAQTKAGWNAERAAAIAARQQAETRYRSLAHEADVAHDKDVADGGMRLAAYAAAHRLHRSQADPASPAQGDGPGLSAIPPTEAIVASLSDLRACDADYAYAKAAYDWAKGLNAKP
jgi:hypothetical protein